MELLGETARFWGQFILISNKNHFKSVFLQFVGNFEFSGCKS